MSSTPKQIQKQIVLPGAIYSAKEVAAILDVGIKTVYRYKDNGALKGFTVNPDGLKASRPRCRFYGESVLAFIQTGGTMADA